jgi:hypothetical protein
MFVQGFDAAKLMDGCQISPSPTSGSLVKAPLATPDPVDVFGDYAQVKVCNHFVSHIQKLLFVMIVLRLITSFHFIVDSSNK